MQRGELMLYSAEKNNRRPSILKNNNNPSTTKQTGQSTGLGQTVTFKDQQSSEKHIKEFTEDSPKQQFKSLYIPHDAPNVYSKQMLTKKLGLINLLYNDISIMISSYDPKIYSGPQQGRQISEMVTSIENVLTKNTQLKQRIDKQYKKVKNLHQIAEYLHILPQDLLHGRKLQEFTEFYNDKEQELRYLSIKCRNLQFSEKKHKTKATRQQKREKERRVKQLQSQIEKQRRKIGQLQKEERSMISRLSKFSKVNQKTERTHSALKMKINEIQCRRSYTKLKKKPKETPTDRESDKQNLGKMGLGNKIVRMGNVQKLTSKRSLAKLVRK